jgi:hypothetical protein
MSSSSTNSKKRTATAAALSNEASPVADKAEVKTEKTEKKTKKAPAPKKEKKPKEEKKATASSDSGDGAADGAAASGDEPAKKKRKVVRFNPHNPCDYLDLKRYWKNHESLRIGLLKAQAAEQTADEAGDKDKADEAAASVARYTGVLQRLEGRRSDVMLQLKSVAELLTHGQLADPLLSRLVPAFDPRPEAEKEDDVATPATAAAAASSSLADAEAEPKEAQA